MRCIGASVVFLLMFAERLEADWKDDIGYTQLASEVGGTLESGVGVAVAMSEAFVSGSYLPDSSNAEFSGKTLIDASGIPSSPSGHATSVARLFFGNTSSIAKGVSQVTLYQADDWLEQKLGWTTGADPISQPFQVMNHSWVGNSADDAEMIDALQRVDYVVNRDDVLMLAGTSNSNTGVPDLLGHGYNAMIVGKTDGVHGWGSTTMNGSGRTRPDIVAPASVTSSSTPMVASAAALLHEVAAGTDAARSETMRAVLMAGATKEEFASWDRTTTRPIDDVFGAGELNVYNSYQILKAGEFDGSNTAPTFSVGLTGWDYVSAITPVDTMYYNFDVAQGQMLDKFSISLNWNLEVIDTDPSALVFSAETHLANLSMRLYNSSDSFLGSLVDASLSPVDNVEHIYISGLSAGTYTLQINTDRATDYGLAWRSSLTAVPEPSSLIVLSLGVAGMGVYKRRRITRLRLGKN